jgi:hypothetical protein
MFVWTYMCFHVVKSVFKTSKYGTLRSSFFCFCFACDLYFLWSTKCNVVYCKSVYDSDTVCDETKGESGTCCIRSGAWAGSQRLTVVGRQYTIAWLKHNVTTETSCWNSKEIQLEKFVLRQPYSILKIIQIKDPETIYRVMRQQQITFGTRGSIGKWSWPIELLSLLSKTTTEIRMYGLSPRSKRVTFQMQTILEMLTFEPTWCIYFSFRRRSSVYFQLCCSMQSPHSALFAYLSIALVSWCRTYAQSLLGLCKS